MRKIKRGTGFKGVCLYVEFGENNVAGHGRWIGGTAAGQSAKELAPEFRAVAKLRPDIEKPVWHNSLRLPKNEDVTDEIWIKIADRYMEKMGFDLRKIQYKIGKDDVDEHIHIVANRVATDGTIFLGQNENLISTRVIAELEHEFGLRITPGVNSAPSTPRVTMPTKNEQEKAIRLSKKPPRLVMQEAISAAMSGRPPTSIFLERLDAAGIEAVPNVATTGRMNGFTFELDGLVFSGSKLGGDFKWASLEKRIDYEQDRDSEELIRRRAAAFRRAENDRVAGAPPDTAGRDEPDPAATKRDTVAAGALDGTRGSDRPTGLSDHADRSGAGGTTAVDAVDRQSAEGDRVGLAAQWPEPAGVDTGSTGVGGRHPERVGLDEAGRIIEGLARPVEQKDVAAKVAAWRQQHAALSAEAYRLTMTDRVLRDGRNRTHNIGKSKDGGDENFYDAATVEKMIPELRRKNAQGFDVYLTPIDKRFHYIVVDDMTPQSLGAMRADGHVPALVQSSSAGNQQAIVKVERVDRKDEQQIANQLVVELNRAYGDPKFSGVIHPFRMAGFSNKKPGRGNAFTRVVEAIGAVCARAMGMLSSMRAKVDSDAASAVAKRQRVERINRIENEDLHQNAGPLRLYHQEAKWMLKNAKQPVDWSAIDFGVSCEMLKKGFGKDEVATVLREGSPEIGKRHADLERYVQTTVKNAALKVGTGGSGGTGIGSKLNIS